jgi:hypothetical protein
VRREDGRYSCALCGEVLDLPAGARVTVTVVASAGRPNVRVVSFRRNEIHRCLLEASAREHRATPGSGIDPRARTNVPVPELE